MQIYRAFNSNGVSVVVTDAELDDAARGNPPLSTQLADAAAQARRTDLIGHLRASLDGDDRAQKLAAATSLLALDDRDGCALLEQLATTDADAVVAKSFLAVATRLRGIDAAVEKFNDPNTDPQLARLLVSNYNSHLRPEIGDVRFLIQALQRYVDRSLPWLPELRAEMWDNGVALMLDGLSHDNAVRLLREHATERAAVLSLVSQLGEHTDDDDLLGDASSLFTVLSD